MDIRIDGSDMIQHGELYGMSCVIWMNFMACGKSMRVCMLQRCLCVCVCISGSKDAKYHSILP